MITRDSICWPTVEAACMERIEALRFSLENAPLHMIERMQGEVAALRWLLLQAEAPTIPKSTSMDV